MGIGETLSDERSTLAGVATGTPDGGVAIVRISGPAATRVAAALVEGALPAARRAGLRHLRLRPEADAGAASEPVEHGTEQAVVVVMPGPRSFTGEDVVELQIHAGERNVAEVLEACLAAGAVAAGPGDFSRRAFELGRMTLDQAEGVAALIGARTQAALEQARRLVAGELGEEVEDMRARVGQLRVEIEANLDFPEDVAAADEARFAATAQALAARVEGWLARFEAGRRARSRARVVIAGPPNAGKSALFNALLGRRRALVSDLAGTTRDFLEAELSVPKLGVDAEVELTLVDTAGLREDTADELERAGVALGREQLEGADLIVWVEGADQPAGSEDIPALAQLRVENKADLEVDSPRQGWLRVSAHTGAGLDELRAAIGDALSPPGEQWIGLARHRERAAEALAALVEARALLAGGEGLELAAFSLTVADRRLGEITGRAALGPMGAEILDAIFSRFCIGK
ncbi:50S ribosome-binding GTPase [Pseudenhygromyxa sp. WMMC2535]|uniref:tRNA modification GTPase n=1 Tax=Pseudenhygromyxa sp. WMMC2535 TaxID=2712867 RepID=UPI001554B58B|nr:GTPase [Pseudenhygromyxa sp. WMMC2535]NVB37941.1 50S ribosome-binding GTPase [Pseudenhygromyxa sp. WMMC2535]